MKLSILSSMVVFAMFLSSSALAGCNNSGSGFKYKPTYHPDGCVAIELSETGTWSFQPDVVDALTGNTVSSVTVTNANLDQVVYWTGQGDKRICKGSTCDWFNSCSCNPLPADDFEDAPLICNTTSYCGNTSNIYGADVEADSESPLVECNGRDDFSGSIENNSWLRFIADNSTVTFDIDVENGCYIQFSVFEYNPGASDAGQLVLMSDIDWTTISEGFTGSQSIDATGLTPGKEYYLHFDGNGGADCDYELNITGGISFLDATASTSTVCPGAPTTLSVEPHYAGTQYFWYDPSGTLITTTTTPSLVVNPSAAGTYSVTVLGGACLANNSLDIPITIDAGCTPPTCTAPTISNTSNDETCAGDNDGSVDLTIDNNGSATSFTYTWTGPNAFSSSNQDIGSLEPGTYNYSVSGDDDDGTCAVNGSVTINAGNTAIATFTDFSICENDNSASLPVTSNEGITGVWDKAFDNTQTDTYGFTADPGQCATSGSITITVDELPVVTMNNEDTTSCGTINLPLDAVTTVGSLTWSDGSTQFGNGVIINPGSLTTYTVTADNNGCTDSDQFTVTVSSPPTFTVSAADPSGCAASDGTVSVSGLPAGDFDIDVDGTSTTYTSDGTNPVVIGGFGPSTISNVTVTDPTTSCSASDNTGWTISTPGAPTVATSNDTTICINSVVAVSATASAGNLSWDQGHTNGSSITFDSIGVFTYTATADEMGCISTDAIQITVVGLPQIGITRTQDTICFGDDIDLQGSGGVDYAWSTGETTATITVSPVDYTPYQLVVTDANGCTADSALFISVVDQPSITVANANPMTLCAGETDTLRISDYTGEISWPDGSSDTLFVVDGSITPIIVTTTALCGNTATETINILSGTGPAIDAGTDASIEEGTSYPIDATATDAVSYDWTPVEGLSCIDCEDPIATPEETTTYYVTATSADGCTSVDSIVITILEDESIWWPNAMTGGEGDDCCFGFTAGDLDDYYLRVYNRWGELMFESRDQEEVWNGTFRGKPVQTGVYTFIMEYVDNAGEPQVIGGNITIVK